MATVAIIAIGNRGDVAPLTGVGACDYSELGHRVIVLAYQAFAELVTGCGLEFRGLADELDGTVIRSVGRVSTRGREGHGGIPVHRSGMRCWAIAVLAAVRDEPLGRAAAVAVRGAGRPSACRQRSPFPVSAFGCSRSRRPPTIRRRCWEHGPPASSGTGPQRGSVRRWSTGCMAGPSTRLSYAIVGLPTDIRLGCCDDRRTDARWPILYELLAPRSCPGRPIWRPGIEVDVSYWWPAHRTTGWQPPPPNWWSSSTPARHRSSSASAARSTAASRPSSCPRLSHRRVRGAGARAVIQAGWAGLDFCGDDVIAVGDVPTTGCLPRRRPLSTTAGRALPRRDSDARCAGDRGAGPLRRPTVLGAKAVRPRSQPRPISQRRLSADNLGEAIHDVLSDHGLRRPGGEDGSSYRCRGRCGAGFSQPLIEYATSVDEGHRIRRFRLTTNCRPS